MCHSSLLPLPSITSLSLVLSLVLLIYMLICLPRIVHTSWHAAADQVIATVYTLAEHPDKICAGIINRLSTSVFGAGALQADRSPTPGCTSATLDRLFFFVGHVAVETLDRYDDVTNIATMTSLTLLR